MDGRDWIVRVSNSAVKLMIFALAAIVLAFGAIAHGSDVEQYEGTTMVFEIDKPVTNTGYNYPEKVRYSYSVNDGTAQIGSDYAVPDGTQGKIVFPEGSGTTAKINIKLFDDDLDEGDGETLQLVLTTPQYEAANNMYLYGFYLPTRIEFNGLVLDPADD